jgi:hypothetical protein
MSKYDPLQHHLSNSRGAVELQFTDIEELLEFDLPASARRHAAWWSNSGGSHVQSAAWLNAGYRTQNLDLSQERVRFVPEAHTGFGEMKQSAFGHQQKVQAPPAPEAAGELKRHPAFGVWKGKVTLLPDYDYTQPADPDWGKVYDK